MFTGLVEETTPLLSFTPSGADGATTLRVKAPIVSQGTRLGDSIAVNGCCLTVTEIEGETLSFDLLEETLRLTNLGAVPVGGLLNLERALSADGRFGGHFVQGHVDCTAPVLKFQKEEGDIRLEIGFPQEFAHLLVYKGSICVNGVSLTVAELREESFVVCLIPTTLAHTNLRELKPGMLVNLEFDLLAKHTERILKLRATC